MWSKIATAILKLFGWTTSHEPFPEPRGIIIAYPHTSNWDFPLGVLWNGVHGVRARWVGKESLFKPAPIGWVMRKLGGIGIKREGNLEVAQSLKHTILAEDTCWLTIAIEGTRKHKPYIHMGYYYIAKAADIPVGIAQFNYDDKTISVGEYRRVKDTVEEEIEQLKKDFAVTNAHTPVNVGTLAVKPKRTP